MAKKDEQETFKHIKASIIEELQRTTDLKELIISLENILRALSKIKSINSAEKDTLLH